MLLLLLLFHIVLAILTCAIKCGKENFQKDWKKRTKLSLFTDDMEVYIGSSFFKTSSKLLEIMGKFSKVAGYKINIHKSIAFLEWSNKEKVSFTILSCDNTTLSSTKLNNFIVKGKKF